MAKLKVGVIGTGAIAQHCHLPGYQAHPDCDLVALADVDAGRVAEAAKKFGAARTYGDWREMLDSEELDIVSVCTPNYLHAEMASEVARRGINLMVEKPIALSMAEAVQIRDAVRAGGGKCMVCFTHRLYSGNKKIKQMIEDDVIGEPFMIRVRFAHRGPEPGWAMSDWFYRKAKAGGGAVLDMGIHAMDLAQYMLGPIAEVTGITGMLRKDIEVDDNAVATLKFASGKAFGYIEVGWTSGKGFGGLEVYGDKGSILYNYGKPIELYLGAIAPDGSSQTDVKEIEPDEGLSGWQLQMKTIVDCVRDDVPTPITIDDGVSASAVAMAIVRSAETGQAQAVETL